MRNIKTVLLTLLVLAGTFSTVVFTACTKVDCANVVCQNGGTCSNGTCSCPTGYSGPFCESPAVTAIVYKNNTFTPIQITVNSVLKSIPVGASVVFTGKFGTDATGTAITYGSAKSLGISTEQGIIGIPINWNISNSFPSSDTLRQSLDVGATYFFLRIINKTSFNVLNYYVNAAFPYGQYYADVTIPNDGKTYEMGYYLAYQGSNVQTQNSSLQVKLVNVTFPFATNQSVTVEVPN